MVYLFGAKLKQNKAGFTLLEMVTSMALIVVITTVFIANYRSSNKRTDLTMTAQKLVADIHAAQNNTLGLVKYGDEVPAGGWGINFNTSQPDRYVVFADLDRPASSEPGQIWPADSGYMRYDATTEGLENQGARAVALPAGISINGITIGTTNMTQSGQVNVSFLPPDPKTNISNGITTSTVMTVTLKEAREGAIKTIRVNFLGLVEVIN